MKRILVILPCAALCAASIAQTAGTSELEQSEKAAAADRLERAKDTLAFINHLNYLYAVLKTYNNVVVLQEEYDRLSLDQIDVTKIPDDIMGEEVRKALDTLKSLKMSEDEYAFYQETLDDERMAARRQLFFSMLAAGHSASGEMSAAFAQGLSAGPHVAAAKAAVAAGGALARDSAGAFSTYQSTLDTLRKNAKAKKFEHRQGREKAIDEYNKNLVPKESAFARTYGLSGSDIVTAGEVQELIDCLKDDNRRRIFDNLRTDAMQRHYAAFPMFWFYLATTAVEAKEWTQAIAAARRFECVNRGLVKVDPMAANVAIAKVTAMVAHGNPDLSEIRRELERIRYVNTSDKHPDWSYFCAAIYHGVLRDDGSAREVLRNLIGNLERKYEKRLRKFRTLFDKGEMSLEENPIPVEVNLLRARVLYKDTLGTSGKKGTDGELAKTLAYICSKSTTSSLEKLYYVGDVRISDLWNMARKDILGIRLYYVHNRMKKNEIVVDVPVNWFLLGEVESRMELMRSGRCVAELKEKKGARSIRRNPDGKGLSIVRMRYVCPKHELVGVDEMVLSFLHEAWPVKLTYRPAAGYSMQTARFRDDETPYTPTKAVFMGETRDLFVPDPNVKEFILADAMKDWSHVLLPYPAKGRKVNIDTNFVVSVEVGEDMGVNIAYRNETQQQGTLKLEVSCYSAYGAQICRLTGEAKMDSGHSGGTCQMGWPSELAACETPVWMLLQYNVSQNVWEWWKNRKNGSTTDEKAQSSIKSSSSED